MFARAPRSGIAGNSRQRPSRRRGRTLAPILASIALLVACTCAAATLVFSRTSYGGTVVAALDRLVVDAGFAIARHEISGNRLTPQSRIIAALAVDPAPSHVAFDIVAARQRIESLPWVLNAHVYRILPDAVGVEVTERQAALLWRAPEQDVLIDLTGRQLAAVPRGSDVGLPVVTGPGAESAAPDLIGIVKSHPHIERLLVEAHRIDGRRWTLQLSTGTLIHLPASGLAAALAWVDATSAGSLLDGTLEVVDLRVPGQLVVRGGGNATAKPPPPQATARITSSGGAL